MPTTFQVAAGPITFTDQLADAENNLLGDATLATAWALSNVVGTPGTLTGNVFTPTGEGSFDIGAVDGALTGTLSVVIADTATQLVISGSQAPAAPPVS